ncbi:MAG: TMEM165/GDT1 family protein [Actinobacteria bacterium]|nr:TMEM165/GDT1 family protein [Actinomycetota bacterium]
MLNAFLLSFGVIFVAELGDKSQLMALAFASRFRAVPVLVAITLATAVVHLASVAIGGAVGAALPTDAINLVGALAFIFFGFWTLRGDELSEEDEKSTHLTARNVIIAVGTVFFLAELGDKTMLATVTLATDNDVVGTWAGSTLGMVAADALAIGVGKALGDRLPERAIRIGSAVAAGKPTERHCLFESPDFRDLLRPPVHGPAHEEGHIEDRDHDMVCRLVPCCLLASRDDLPPYCHENEKVLAREERMFLVIGEVLGDRDLAQDVRLETHHHVENVGLQQCGKTVADGHCMLEEGGEVEWSELVVIERLQGGPEVREVGDEAVNLVENLESVIVVIVELVLLVHVSAFLCVGCVLT